MGDTKIEWTNKTWNPVRGCSRKSEGCRNCYAERVATRFSGPGAPYEGLITDGKWNGKMMFVPEHIYDPLSWQKPNQMVFVNSMSDLFHENLEEDFIAQIFGVMAWAGWKHGHVFQVLTKRPKRMRQLLNDESFRDLTDTLSSALLDDEDCPVSRWYDVFNRRTDDARATGPEISDNKWWPLPNVWLGVSVENQATADERIAELLKTPAAARFVSYEPALGPVDFSRWMYPMHWHWDAKFNTREEAQAAGAYAELKRQALVSAHAVFIDWLIGGGESGHGARPMHPDWARSARDQCAAAGVAFFFKQWGEWAPDYRVDDPDLHVWPDNTAMRRVGKKRDEFPEVQSCKK